MNAKPKNAPIVLSLIAVMLISGIIIPVAYMRYLNNREFRPPFEKGLTKNIRVLDDLRGVTDLGEFGGYLWVAYCTSTEDGNRNELLHKKVHALRAHFPEETIKAAVFVVDVTIDQKEKLAAYRADFPELLTEEDYIIAGNAEVLQKYLRNEFQFEGIPYQKDGSWIYDHDLIILDRLPANKDGNRPTLAHMRGQLDFLTAIERDQEAIKANAGHAPYEKQLNDLLLDSFQYLIENPNEQDKALMGEKKK